MIYYVLACVAQPQFNKMHLSITRLLQRNFNLVQTSARTYALENHILKKTCPDLTINGWKEIVVTETETGEATLKYIYEGEDKMQILQERFNEGNSVNKIHEERIHL